MSHPMKGNVGAGDGDGVGSEVGTLVGRGVGDGVLKVGDLVGIWESFNGIAPVSFVHFHVQC